VKDVDEIHMDPEDDFTSRMLDNLCNNCATGIILFPTLHNTVINESNRASQQQQQHAFGSGDKISTTTITSQVVVDA